jgi:hypothetical protein
MMEKYHFLKIILGKFYEEFKKNILEKTYDSNFFNEKNILKKSFNPFSFSKRLSFLLNIKLKNLVEFFENEK